MRLVEYHQVVRRDVGLAERSERALRPEGVEGDNCQGAAGSGERVYHTREVLPGHDAESQAKEGTQLAFPVAHEAGRRNDQHATNSAAEEHLPDVEPRHDGLAGARVVGEQKAQRLLLQHPLIDRDALMG